MPIYAITCTVVGTEVFTFQSKFDAIVNIGNTSRQSIFIFASANWVSIYGLLAVTNKGAVSWTGTNGVTAKIASDGRVSVTLSNTAYDVVTLISGEALSK